MRFKIEVVGQLDASVMCDVEAENEAQAVTEAKRQAMETLALNLPTHNSIWTVKNLEIKDG